RTTSSPPLRDAAARALTACPCPARLRPTTTSLTSLQCSPLHCRHHHFFRRGSRLRRIRSRWSRSKIVMGMAPPTRRSPIRLRHPLPSRRRRRLMYVLSECCGKLLLMDWGKTGEVCTPSVPNYLS
uniref:Uncharacterized protein n=1 Tax=Aegilops tauschii subsp. strangulata TaxID=200361 RepID=A0A453JQ47_AEGTS